MSTDPKKMKVEELKHALKEKGLSTTGLKAELIERYEKSLTASPVKSTPTAQKISTPSITSTSNTKPPTTSQSTTGNTTQSTAAPTKSNSTTTTNHTSAPSSIPASSSSADSFFDESLDDSSQSSSLKTGNSTLDAALELKRKRAEKFGTPVELTDAEKKAIREARFGVVQSQPNKKAKTNNNSTSAATTTTATPNSTTTAPVKATSVGEDAEKLAARAKKFGLPTPTPTPAATSKSSVTTTGAKPVGTALSSEDELKKKARADRFKS